MKHIKSTFRALCLVALLCMTSGNAMAYDLIQTNEEIEKLQTNGEHITVLGGNVRIKELILEEGYAVIVLPGANVALNFLDSRGTIYIFGTLNANGAIDFNNSGTIFLVGDNSNLYASESELNPPRRITESEALNKTIKYEGKPATETEHGLKDYWEKGIEFNGDYCPIFYYTDEACTDKISNIEKWKENGRIIYSLPLYKKEAIEAIDNEIEGMTILTEADMQTINAYKVIINNATEIKAIDKAKNDALDFIRPIKVKDTALAAIRAAMQGETSSAYLTGLVQIHIDIIYSSDKEGEIENARDAAIEILNGVIDTYKAIKADVLGTMGTKQNGPAVVVTKGEKSVTLYGPNNVKFIKAEEK